MRQYDGMVNISSEDTHCSVTCVCLTTWNEEDFSIGDAWVTRCPKCNRGYRTEFVLWVYNPNEKDPVYLDKNEWEEHLEISQKRLKEEDANV